MVATGGRTSNAGIPGQVVKLFKEGFPPWISQEEARITQAVFAAGVPAPEVFGEVTLDGRFGIVLGRLEGPTLLQVTRSGAVTFAQAGAIIASLGLSVHRISPPPEALHLRGWMAAAFRLEGDIVPEHVASGILALIDRQQQPGDGLCHGDIHPENVIITADGPRLIDLPFSLNRQSNTRSVVKLLSLSIAHYLSRTCFESFRPRSCNKYTQ